MKKEYKDKSIQVYLSIGSNEGDRERNLEGAILQLRNKYSDVELSPIYETPPWGFESKQYFLNMCVGLKASEPIGEVLKTCLGIESELGRIRKTDNPGYSSRPIDIDILYYDKDCINEEHIQVPHPRMYARNFVLYPLSDIAPNYFDPLKMETVNILKQKCNDESGIVLYKKKLLTF